MISSKLFLHRATTSEPRGVAITHGNILANIEPIEEKSKGTAATNESFHPLRFSNLLPFSHVFGQLLGIFIPQVLAGHIGLQRELWNPSRNCARHS